MKFSDWLIARITRRAPDFIIGKPGSPYLRRWWVIPRNRFFNVYLHEFLRSDDDRALHDHPWVNCSILLRGTYWEHLDGRLPGMVGRVVKRTEGDIVLRRSGKIAHRIELLDGPVWTIFITGPRYREWGFRCPTGWVHWQKFTAPRDSGDVGEGCGE